jgi:hypothetical protein
MQAGGFAAQVEGCGTGHAASSGAREMPLVLEAH